MEVVLSAQPVDAQECEILVAGFFEDERPLQGTCGWVDWRLNGALSRFLIAGQLDGAWKETTLIPSQRRILPSMVLVVGLGKARELSYPRLRELFPYLLETLKKLNVSRVCFSLPEDPERQVEPGKWAELLMEGIADSIGEKEVSGLGPWAQGLQFVFAEGEERSREILLGIETARSILEERMAIRIRTPAQKESDSGT